MLTQTSSAPFTPSVKSSAHNCQAGMDLIHIIHIIQFQRCPVCRLPFPVCHCRFPCLFSSGLPGPDLEEIATHLYHRLLMILQTPPPLKLIILFPPQNPRFFPLLWRPSHIICNHRNLRLLQDILLTIAIGLFIPMLMESV